MAGRKQKGKNKIEVKVLTENNPKYIKIMKWQLMQILNSKKKI